MSDVTIICCYNNEKIYSDFVNNLKTQNCPYELISIDNRGNKKFSSAASAYNSVINQVKTKYVIYSHQDIVLNTSGELAKVVNCLGRIGANDILGAAGVKLGVPHVITNLRQPKNKETEELEYAGQYHIDSELIECDTLDECFFGGHTEHFRKNKFDEDICDNWHLYAVESCLRTRSKYSTGGGGATSGFAKLR